LAEAERCAAVRLRAAFLPAATRLGFFFLVLVLFLLFFGISGTPCCEREPSPPVIFTMPQAKASLWHL
jgi:hypothetical protein